MFRLCFRESLAVVVAIGLTVGVAIIGIPAALAAIQSLSDEAVAGVVQSPDKPAPGVNSVMMTLEPDGDFADGHIRIVLRPDTRPLTLIQARSAAQEAFLETLNEPALADVVSRITIIVELVPDASESDVKQVFQYETKDGKTWSLRAAK